MTALLLLALGSCGVENWPIKTLADPGAAAALSRHVDIATIEAIGKLPPITVRRQYETEGRIVFVKREADEDLHVVLRGDEGGTMVVEFPDPDCLTVPASAHPFHDLLVDAILDVKAARAELELRKLWKNRDGRVRVRGMLFFDRCDASHQPAGHAPNCAELHPVTFLEEVLAPGADGGAR